MTRAGIIRFLPKIQKPVSTTTYAEDAASLLASLFPLDPSVQGKPRSELELSHRPVDTCSLVGANLFDRAVSVVGARESTPYGEYIASELAHRLIQVGMTVVSGAAFGEYQKALQELFEQVLGILLMEKLVSLERVTVDGTKVRAHVNKKTFRRQWTRAED